MIIPHIIDPFVWDKICHNLGAGPRGIKINSITPKNLEPKILELVNNSSYKNKVEQIAGQMGKENFREEIDNRLINIGHHNCHRYCIHRLF